MIKIISFCLFLLSVSFLRAQTFEHQSLVIAHDKRIKEISEYKSIDMKSDSFLIFKTTFDEHRRVTGEFYDYMFHRPNKQKKYIYKSDTTLIEIVSKSEPAFSIESIPQIFTHRTSFFNERGLIDSIYSYKSGGDIKIERYFYSAEGLINRIEVFDYLSYFKQEKLRFIIRMKYSFF